MHKRRATGGKKKAWRKKRKYELGRQPANTKLSSNKTVRRVRVRGGNVKWRALRLDTGNFSWGSEAVTRKTRILDVVYNASNNELVRTQTLVKGAIIQVDAAPFKQWYLQHYGVDIGRKKKTAAKKEGEETEAAAAEEAKKSNHVQRKLEKRQQDRKIDAHIEEQFGGGRLLAAISSRPGQCGRADGYILEGKELEFYMKKIQRKKGKGISRDSMHKRRATGGKKKAWRKKRKYELGRQPANTKLSSNKTVRRVRVRGGNVKWRALRLDTGNYSWGSEAVTRKTRILDVVYNASNNELVRTQTLVKSAIIQVDAAPFKQWYLQHYGVDIGRKKKTAAKKEGEEAEAAATEEVKKSNHVQRKIEKRQQDRKIDPHIEEQFSSGRLLAAISSRPGQCGRADGYILEGKELEFYMKKIQRKKGKGISRDSMHKRRATGGKKKAWRKKRKYELGRQPANTKLSSNKTVRRVRVRGGNVKWRALRLDTGNYSWGSEAVTRKTRILDVVYNASNNELVRTQTLVKSAIIQVDAAPFKQWYLQHYGVDIGRKKKTAAKKEGEEAEAAATEEVKKSNHVQRKIEKRQQDRKIDPHIEEQFSSGRLLAAISSRPGQCGRADGYILEGKELEFYMKKLQRKKGKGASGA
ncbi:UNVERIFIED_CONTAM: 40S ribosomal protein S8 [Sesamum indicum]